MKGVFQAQVYLDRSVLYPSLFTLYPNQQQQSIVRRSRPVVRIHMLDRHPDNIRGRVASNGGAGRVAS